jgi:hypothetical protein
MGKTGILMYRQLQDEFVSTKMSGRWNIQLYVGFNGLGV